MSGQSQTIWETLGIGPTGDKRAIRHAYACKCRECHPEDHPEEFGLLHHAYEQALAWADKNRESHAPGPGGESAAHGEAGKAVSPGQWEELLRDEGEGEQASGSALSSECWDEPQRDGEAGEQVLGRALSVKRKDEPQRDGEEDEQASGSALSPECWEELLRDEGEGEQTSGSALSSECWDEPQRDGEEDEQASGSALTPKRWDELLTRGMEEDAAFPAWPDPLSWQQTDRASFSSAALTGSEELLEQMKLLESFCRDHPPQDDPAWQKLMERWDLLACSSLFRQLGESPCYFYMLFDWLNAERGRLHIPTIIGILRTYQIKKRIIGHPWRARRYERKIPELPRITYEFMFYQSIWDAELFLEKFKLYGDRGKRKAGAAPPGKEGDSAACQRPESRFLQRLLCGVLILLFCYFIRAIC